MLDVLAENGIGKADAMSDTTIEVYATWRNYANRVVVEYVDRTVTVDGMAAGMTTLPVFDAPALNPGYARAVPVWAVMDAQGSTDSEACLMTCGACGTVWPSEHLDYDTFVCALCLAEESQQGIMR